MKVLTSNKYADPNFVKVNVPCINFQLKWFTFLVVVVFTVSCTKPSDSGSDKSGASLENQVPTEQTITKKNTHEFLESLPNTLHMAKLFKRTGMHYDAKLANKPSEVGGYVDPTSQAINLGIYSADMGYAIIHDHNTDALKSLKAVKHLADALQLNMLYQIGPWMEKFERNLNNSDSILSIMAQLQMQSDMLLKDNSRYDILYLSFAGAYSESLFLATQLEKQKPNPALIKRIAEQQLALGKLLLLLESLDDQERYQFLLADLKSVHDMMLKLDKGLAEQKPEKARQMAVNELYPKIATLRNRLIAHS